MGNNNVDNDDIVIKITDRFTTLSRDLDLPTIRPLHVIMDLRFCHTIHPLDLERMLHGRDEDLVHDLVGIRAHLDRDKGELTDGFSPRFTASVPQTE